MLIVRVIPDQTGVAKTFDYSVPDEWADRVEVGTRVRIQLGPRRVGGWVVELGVTPPDGVTLKPLAKLSGFGPSAELLDLAHWAQWRWAAKSPVPFLRTASPERVVTSLPDAVGPSSPPPVVTDPLVGAALVPGEVRVLRLPPGEDHAAVAVAAATLGPALVVCPTKSMARTVAVRMRRAGVPVALHPDEWARAAGGGASVVGTRAAAWARMPDLAVIVVLDEHDEGHQEEGSPTWHVRDLALERARRLGAATVLASPAPTVDALEAGPLIRPDRSRERAGWPIVEVVDRSREDLGANGLFSPRFVDTVRRGGRILCVLNQKGRAVLLACQKCRALARCEHCDGPMRQPTDELVCGRCHRSRPVVCAACGGVRVVPVKLGVSRIAHDLAALAGEPVVEVTSETPASTVDSARLYVGTEAVLHQVGRADVVAFLDIDQELSAARYRAAEQAMALLVRAARVVGDRSGGRLLVQTLQPDHEVLRAATLADPGRMVDAERERRRLFGFPPFGAVAEVAGAAAEAWATSFQPPLGVTLRGPIDGRWRVTAATHRELCDALAAAERPKGRLRLAVDPPRI